jgi:hypothetical protein
MSTPATHTTVVTDFGTVTYGNDWVAATGTPAEFYAWSRRPGNVWPCSALADLDEPMEASFDSNGLSDIQGDRDDLDASEFNAWSSDVIGAVLPESHPAHFVTVGQFRG